jgi:hypothetical protein
MRNDQVPTGQFSQQHGLQGLQNAGYSQQAYADAQQQIDLQKLKMQATMAAPKSNTTKETKVEGERELLPDVSLTRVFKWALIVLVAIALGEKIWSKLGPGLTDNFCKVIGSVTGNKTDA